MSFGGTIKLTGENEYRSALKSIRGDMQLLSSQMKVLATDTDTSGKASQANADKKKQLTAAIQAQKSQISSLNDALAESVAREGANSNSSKALQTQVNNATAQLNRMESQLNATDAEGKKLGAGFDDTGKKAGIFGDVLKANLASEAIIAGVKGILNGVVALGKGLVGIIGDSVKSFAEYEQLVGGLDTLFKDSSNQMQAYAETAYKTAGLSANEYMNTVTSFSAALISGLGGDTAKAAEAANQAVTDMSDNANKMGTDIASIQNAYQGFAKQNYTMLDNLKLGYGGTAEEMARLVNNSGVLGEGVKVTAESVKNVPFDQITQAIHNVQTEMGITGTTAKEAASTISGSFNSVKGSWENVLTSFGTGNNEAIQKAVDGLIESATNLVTNVAQIIPGIVAGLGQAASAIIAKIPGLLTQVLPVLTTALQGLITQITTVLPQLVPVVLGILNSIVTLITENLPMIINAGTQVLTSLITGIAEALPTLIPQIVDAVILIVDTLVQNLPLLIEAGIKILVALIQGIVDALPKLIEALPKVINTLITELTKPSVMQQLIGAALQIIVAVAGGLINAIPEIIKAVPQIINALITGFGSMLSGFVHVGRQVVEGLWNGINNAQDWVIGKIKGFGEAILGGIKSFFGIKSPSRLFRDQVGKNLALGIGEGFTASMDAVTRDMQEALPTSFDTGVDVNMANQTAYAAAAAQQTTGIGGVPGLTVQSLGAALKSALSDMNVVLDDQKVGSFVTQTIERQVFAS